MTTYFLTFINKTIKTKWLKVITKLIIFISKAHRNSNQRHQTQRNYLETELFLP